MSTEQKYWFKAKKYGWGWGLPRTWQGWVVMAIFIAVFTWTIVRLLDLSGQPNIGLGETTPYLVVVFADAFFLMYFCFKHGEPPRWRWGDDDKE